ncbi:DUF688 domain-containing protein [Melia azedarach]|uniref:DUF688 domain-containing protein n=1 Tax=Melia azedarach TaxID=155640 RepID=A0ACC1Z201_MELAZ|nr:DUF688 domain-containing protein [Melia azedarach]
MTLIHREKALTTFRELLANESTKCKSDLASPVEKTLYIDSVHKVKFPKSNSSSSDTKKLSDHQGDDFDALIKSGETEAAHSVHTSPRGIKLLNVISEKATPRPKSLESVDSNFLSSPDNAIIGQNINAKSSSTENRSINLIKLGSPKVDGSGKIDLESQLHRKLSNQESSQEGSPGSYSQLPLSLPPPKSPSDSWLKRTLPTVSVKNSSSWSALGTYNSTRVQTSKTPHVDLKWETIVKTSNVQHGHLHFSEERLTTIPEN